jgi:hypothetical protein
MLFKPSGAADIGDEQGNLLRRVRHMDETAGYVASLLFDRLQEAVKTGIAKICACRRR